ncbi:hypothetical protein D3C81_1661330 [compost metagenome]
MPAQVGVHQVFGTAENQVAHAAAAIAVHPLDRAIGDQLLHMRIQHRLDFTAGDLALRDALMQALVVGLQGNMRAPAHQRHAGRFLTQSAKALRGGPFLEAFERHQHKGDATACA